MIDKFAQVPIFKLDPSFDHIGGRPTNNRIDTSCGFSKLKSKLFKDFHWLLPFNLCSIVNVGGCFTREFLLIEPIIM